MSVSSFDELLALCKEDLAKQDTILRKSIRPEEKLFLTLRYLGSGCSFMEIHYYYCLGHSTIGSIIRAVCGAICRNLESCLEQPKNEDEWEQIGLGFEKHANFPHCIGAIDGKHIRPIKPTDSGSL
ncbi:uncharacterized protein LOC126734225 [Anthonomus grandis grandis]|uniref:uncharacterized protein LOC126734225 n=1 Tax=Anthonomus grandis grandis TaxID=2921223 RepID=UPI002165FD8B|nr:uncharacterized protein LOC126734225 [Anthonomus grandis grandis]